MDTGVRAGPCCSLSRTVPGTRRSWDPWQDLRPPQWGAPHPPVAVRVGISGIEGLWWALGWGSGSVLASGSLLGALATTAAMAGGTGPLGAVGSCFQGLHKVYCVGLWFLG